MAALVQAKDWSKTPLGAMDRWPQSLRTLVDMLLGHPLPMIVLWGPELIQIYNDGYRQIAGEKHPAALGMPTKQCWPEAWHINEPIYEKVMQRGESVFLHDALIPIAPHGKLEDYFFDVAYGPARDESGRVAGVMITVSDMTKKKQAEKALQEHLTRSEQQVRIFDTALSYINDFTYIFDRDGRFLYVNKPLLDLWGLPLEQAVGKNFFDLKYPDDLAAKLQQQISQVIETKKTLVDETPYTSPSGAPGYYEYIFSPVIGADGSVEVVAGSTRVITARKMLELEQARLLGVLRNERANLASIIEKAPAFICTLRGPDHVFELANTHYYELIGKRDIIGKTVRETFPEIEGQGFFELLDNVYKTGEAFVGSELPILFKRHGNRKPEERFINFVYQAIQDVDGAVSGIFVHGVDVTDAVRAREAVARDASILSNVRDAVIVTDLDGIVTYWNAGATTLFQNTAAEMVGRPLITRLPETHRAEVLEWIVKIANGRAEFDGEWQDWRKDGSRVWIEATTRLAHDGNGKPMGIIGVSRDISRRKEAEEKLRAAEERVRLATEAAGLGVWMWDVEADVVTWENDRPYEIFQLPRTTAPLSAARFLKDFIHPDDIPAFERAVAITRETGERFYFRGRIHRTDGQLRWVEFTGRMQRTGDGGPLRLVGTAADITDEKQSQEALRESETRFRQIADTMPQIVWTARPDGTLDYYNRRWFEYIDQPQGVIGEGIRWDLYIHPDDLPRAYEAWAASVHTGETYVIEFRVRRADDTYRWFLVRAVPHGDADGKIIRWLGTCTDIDDQKKLQAQNEHLLSSERAARDSAETANRAKDKFLAVLSHELRTPLTPVAMAATAMEMDPRLPFEFREDVTMIRRNVELETRLIDDLLDLSRVISGKLRLNLQPTNLHNVITNVMQTVGAEIHEKRLTVEMEMEAKNDAIEADAARLQQTLWNLLKNAAKFTPEGGTVRVRTYNAGSRVVVEVIDTGRGITPEALPKVFEPFEQGDPTVTTQYGGMGLGLAIAKAVVDLHGGVIHAFSAGAGHGATFTVALPLRKAAPALPKERASDPAGGATRPLRLLLVEDHADTAKTLTRLLRLDGMDVRWAGTVAEAIKVAGAHEFDLIVSDLGLPDGSGLELLRQLRREKSNVPAIAMSGYGMDDDLRQSREAGFMEHLIKPVNVPQLRQAIRRVAGTGGNVGTSS